VKAFQVEPELSGITIDCACFAVAGPVKLNSVTMTNKGHWTIQGEEVASKCGMKCVQIVNDFVGAGYGLLTLDVAKDCVTIQAGDERIPSAPIACLGAGTGLGECFITPSGDEPADGGEYQYQCFPSEGGHVEFAPRNEEEFALLSYLTSLYPARVSVERIVSGQGICDVYDFYANVRHPEKKRANEALHASIAAGKEAKSGLIANNAGSDELCMMAMTMFATVSDTDSL
jgi:glucokinase